MDVIDLFVIPLSYVNCKDLGFIYCDYVTRPVIEVCLFVNGKRNVADGKVVNGKLKVERARLFPFISPHIINVSGFDFLQCIALP